METKHDNNNSYTNSAKITKIKLQIKFIYRNSLQIKATNVA